MKNAFRLTAGLLLSAFFLWLALRGVSWPEVRSALGSANWWWLPAMVVATVASVWFRAIRWGHFVRHLVPATHANLVSATAIGFAANMLLPLRAGEILRPWILSRREPIDLGAALATIALERLFDMAALLAFFSIAVLALPVPDEWRRSGWFFLVSFLVLVGSLVALRSWPDRARSLAKGVTSPISPRAARLVVGLVDRFANGLAALGDLRVVLVASGWSLAVWAAIALSFGFGLVAFDLDVPWVSGSLTVTLFVAIAVAVPGGPGFVGMFQAGCVLALALYGISRAEAFGFSVVIHLAQFSGTVLFGLIFFLREGFSIRDVRAVSAEAPDPLEGEL